MNSQLDGSGAHSSASPGALDPQQQIAMLQHQLALAQQQQRAQSAPHVDLGTLAAILQQQQAAQQQQQLQATAQLLSLQALGALPPFTGKGAGTGLAALEWLQLVERYFAARETALGISAAQADATRVMLAANALQEDAQRWYNALPVTGQPLTWRAFRDALRGRYSSVPAVRVRLEQLRSFVDAARRLRERMTLEGLHGYTSRFQQLAGEIPDTHLTAHGKLELLARGLSTRLAELVLTEDARESPAPLHEVVQKVLAKAAFKELAGAQSSGSAEAMQLDAVSLCAAQFGVSREEAARYVEPGEGWAPHDTEPGLSASPASGSAGDDAMERLLAAFTSRFSAAASGSSGPQSKGQSQRRNVPRGVRADVPEELAKARRDAGLCIKCGVAKYEPGGKGHNSVTCKASVDKTTSAAEGRKKANF